MADVNGKKRKRTDDGGPKPKKKITTARVASTTVSVSSVLRPKFCPPIIATSPGLRISNVIPFIPYTKKEDASSKRPKKTPSAISQDLLLHSRAHPTMDYTAREDQPNGGEPLLKHYIGVFDEKTKTLKVVEAKKLVVRGVVRAKQAGSDAMGERTDFKTYKDLKTDLGQTFGTKKARKVIESNVINAISPQKGALDENGTPKKLDAAAKAIMEVIGEATATMASREDLQAAVDKAKPVPKANLDADEIQDVYDLDEIIGDSILQAVPTRDWIEATKKKEAVQLRSRFVAHRIQRIASLEQPVEKLRLLRYMYLLLLFFISAKPGKQRGTRRILPKDQLHKFLQPAGQMVIESIRRKFSDSGEMRKFHIDLLTTHCCLFACIIDNYEVNTWDLKEDLQLDQRMINQYFHEIGGRVKPVTDKEKGRTHQIARLTLPLDFPTQRHINPRRR